MSKPFKQNSRFSVLMDEEPIFKPIKERVREKTSERVREKTSERVSKNNETFNSFKSNRPNKRDTCFRQYDEKELLHQEQEKQLIKDFNNKEKERKIIKALSIDNFPDLLGNYKNNNNNDNNEITTNYMEQIKKTKIVVNNNADIDLDLVNLMPGWVMIKPNLKTGFNIIKGHPIKHLTEKTQHNEIVDSLNLFVVQLHEKRTQCYIDLYGYDMWYDLFKGQNYNETLYDDDEDLDDDEDTSSNYDEYYE